MYMPLGCSRGEPRSSRWASCEHTGVLIEHPGGAQRGLFGSWFVWEPVKAPVDRDFWHFFCASVDVEALGGMVARSHQRTEEARGSGGCVEDQD